jgi:hypothetical protein
MWDGIPPFPPATNVGYQVQDAPATLLSLAGRVRCIR